VCTASLFLAYGSKIWAKGKPSYEKKRRKYLSDFWVKNRLGCFKMSNSLYFRNPKSNILIFGFLKAGFTKF
jgi:hypothetical protein